MELLATFLTVAYALLFTLSEAASVCKEKRHGAYVPDPESCQGFIICFFGYPIHQKCGEGQVWSPDYSVCCMKESILDTCTALQAPEPKTFISPEDPDTCKPGMTNKLAHPKNCARYLDCAQTGVVRGLEEDRVRECTFPKLFSSKTFSCENPELVDCGDKTKPKDACEYEMNKCHRSHCIPCWVRFASCTGQKDGKQVWAGKEKSPHYAECKDERVMKHGRCPSGQLFHPTLLHCADAQLVLES